MVQTVISKRDYPPGAFNAARECGYTVLQARIIAARLPYVDASTVAAAIAPSLSMLDRPDTLPDIGPATTRIADAIVNDERLAVCVDHDVDGSTGGAITYLALVDHFGVDPQRVTLIASHRLREGYGVSDALAERVIGALDGRGLVVTVDQGSANGAQIARLREVGIDTVVTDHHEIPLDGIPREAVAVVNPTREDGLFPDPSIAGCYVAFLVMCAVREELIRRGALSVHAPKLTPLLQLAALGTVADCVDLGSSANNRAVVRYGLHLMNTQPMPCMVAMRRANKGAPFSATTLGWFCGPLLNASGRMDNSLLSVAFLLAKEVGHATALLEQLQEHNTARKAVQDTMLQNARPEAALQAEAGLTALVIYQPNGHPGTHGVVCGRLAEAYARPAVFLSPKQGVEGVLTGSLRSVEGVNIKAALDRAKALAPDSIISHGGHRAAGGVAVQLSHLRQFADAFRAAVGEQVQADAVQRTVFTEGEPPRQPDHEMVAEIAALEPYGQKFPIPAFESRWAVVTCAPVGDGRHLKLVLCNGSGCTVDAIWFGALEHAGDALPLSAGQSGWFTYTLAANTFRGATRLDLQILELRKESSPCGSHRL